MSPTLVKVATSNAACPAVLGAAGALALIAMSCAARTVARSPPDVVSRSEPRSPGPPTVPPTSPEASSPPQVPSLIAKLHDFLRANLFMHANRQTWPTTPLTVRLHFDASGAVDAAELRRRSGDLTVDASVEEQLRDLVARRARLETLSPEERHALAERNVSVMLYAR